VPLENEYHKCVMDDANRVAPSKEQSAFSRRLLDLCLLVGSALIVCAVGLGAFLVAEIRHVNPLWVFFGLISIGFVAGAREEYRKEFRSVRFVFFVLAWLVINMAVIVGVLTSFGWLYLIPALFLEQVLFYMTAYWLFGLEPPSRRGRRG
jgi:hypothetical protein